MTVIVILALVALFIGLRLYSVLGERTGHEQQPILKPADPDARVGPQVSQPAPAPSAPVDSGDMAFVPTAGPGVRARLEHRRPVPHGDRNIIPYLLPLGRCHADERTPDVPSGDRPRRRWRRS